jgi:putative nucleotidyltransferase with HDIG domain
MLAWLKRIFGVRQAPTGVVRAAAPAGRSATAAARREAPFPIVTSDAAPVACPVELVDQTAHDVLQRFRANKPGAESFPSNASRIIDVIRQKEPDFNKLVQIVGQDAAIASRLLQVANSSLFTGAEVHSVRAAAMRLGLREVGEIALGFAGRTLFETEVRYQYSLFPHRWDALFHESMTAAFAAGALSMRTRSGQPDCAFLAGMLHDIGKPIALRAVASLYHDGGLDPVVLDLGVGDVVDRVHIEIGAVMTETWGLPEYLRVAATRHHDPVAPGDPPDLHLARVVDGLGHARAGSLTQAGRDLLLASAAALKLGEAELRVAATEYAELAERVAQIFHVRDPHAGAPAHKQRRAG